jgi:hypothetical protein
MSYKPRESDGSNLNRLITSLGDNPVQGSQNVIQSNIIKSMWNLKRQIDENTSGLGDKIPDQINAVYVSKAGNDSDDGLTQAKPKLTIASAKTASDAMSAPVAIIVLDAGVYTENVVLPSNIHLFAPMASLAGSITMGGVSSVVLDKHYASVSGQTMVDRTDNGAGLATYCVNEMDGRGIAAGFDNGSCIYPAGTGSLFVQARRIIVTSTTGWAITDETTGCNINFDIGEIALVGVGSNGIRSDGDSSSIIGRVGTISGASGIAIYANSQASIQVVANAIAGATSFWVADAANQLQVICGAVDGARAGSFEPFLELSGDTVLKARPITESGTTRILSFYDLNKYIRCTNAGAVVVTVPTGLVSGFQTTVWANGAGGVTIRGANTVTLNGNTEAGGGESDVAVAQYKAVTIVSNGSNNYDVIGG